MAWEIQNEWKKKPIPSRNEFVKMLSDIESPMVRALCSLCYLTAGRISEVCSKKELIKTHYKKHKKVKKVDGGYLITKKTLRNNKGQYIIDKIEHEEINYKGITKKDFSTGYEIINGEKVQILYITMAIESIDQLSLSEYQYQ